MNRKIFITLFFSTFVSVTGVGIVVPLLPVYAHSLGASGFLVGMIFGSFSISRTVLLPYFGKLSDKKGRKPFIASGLFLYGLVSIAFMAANGVNQLIFIRFLQGIASAMIFPVVHAYVGEMAPKGREGFVMGVFTISMYASLSVGPLLGGVVNDYFGLRTAFACMGVLSFLAFCLCMVFLPPTKKEPRPKSAQTPTNYSVLLKNPNILGPTVLRMANTFCIGAIWGFLPVYAESEFGLSSSRIGILISMGVAVPCVLMTPMGWLADKINKHAMILVGAILMASAVFSFTFAPGFWFLFAGNVIFGIGGGIMAPPIMAICVIEGNKVGAMGSVVAIMTVGHSLGMLVGSLVSGVFMDLFSIKAVFVAGAAAIVLGTAFFMRAPAFLKKK